MRKLVSLLVSLAIAGCGSASLLGSTTPYAPPTSAGNPPLGCHFRVQDSELYAEPDPRCTPGEVNPNVTQANIGSTICRHGWTKTIRPPQSVTEPEKLAEMSSYGLVSSPHGYELDHLISLELGGAPNSYKNFWPEPNYPHRRGFYLNPKDRLENALNHLVCDGRMSLSEAQHLITTDWVSAYKRYAQ